MDKDPASAGTARRRVARTILVVDGDRARLGDIAQRLGDHGYLILRAENGTQALELATARQFDLVLVDAQAPDGPGLHVIQEIRGTRETVDLPVVVLAEEGIRAALAAFSAGADDYVTRPFDFALLAARIERILVRADRLAELKRSNLALDARVADRAIELGEARSDVAGGIADRARLAATIRSLEDALALRANL
ncbi:MAG: hybrid sensor histidine kinase/response regulator [Sphingomonadales bacterium]|nr:MAG: hybrid sensor histidine kinase/response regulator [Sphingomonadales bacterium]